MFIKPPGGEVSFWSALWILFALVCVYFAYTVPAPLGYLSAACIGLPAVGMWLGQRWCGYVLALFFVLVIPLGAVALFVTDVTINQKAIRLVRIAMSLYFAWMVFQWAREQD